MGYYRGWQPSKAAKYAFISEMRMIEDFLREHPDISASSSRDSYYFSDGTTTYRVSNHSPESSPYHDGREKGTRYIHASKTRIINIYTAIMDGKRVDGHGRVVA